MSKIYFQGTFGAYSHLAALSIFKNIDIIPCKTFDECFLKASKDDNSKIIIPESNRITGNIGIEYLIFKYRLNIYSEYFQKIEHNLLGLPGTKISEIKDVYSHGQALSQCKSSVIFGGIKADGRTIIKAKKSRDHTELLLKYLKLPIKIIRNKNYDLIEINKVNKIKPFNYIIPSDISSGAFFIALTVLSKNSKLLIKNVNVNPTRIGFITILKKMGVKILLMNKKIYKGEIISDILVKSPKNLKSINCPSQLNSGAIDEFLIIFLIAAKAKGVSFFKSLDELNKKESPRLKWGSKILKMMGVKVITSKNSIKIFGNPQLEINKKIVIKKYLKDHRVFMTSVIAALTFGGEWHIHDKDSIKTSFPSFLKILSTFKNEK